MQKVAAKADSVGAEPYGAAAAALQQVVIPDLWQQEAVSALRARKDVVVHAPTGAGKTLIFELWSNGGRNRGQAIYTVPTRALANDKLAEWRARGWNVGIATGDLADNLDAPVIVATLETQKNRLIQGDGPSLLVVDEYQMIGDDDRGLNYELAIALAPPQTQLLLLSGSVGNPDHIVNWLHRLGREAVLVKHQIRPVPLEEVFAGELSWHLPSEIKGYWPRFCAKALAEDLGPILLFAPRRQHAEELAADLARQLPNPNPLKLTDAQKKLVGDHLARLLNSRVAYHHSGLSYAARAGVIEPLAKAGQLRVVVATMGLAAGINFSLRSVAVTSATYKREGLEIPLRSDEILQMFGRAGRRGMDEVGYVLVSANEIRIRDAHSAHLSRNGMVDWSALLSLMAAAADQGRDPYGEAVRVQERLFTTKPIFLGVEQSMKHPVTPCGLRTDSERARHVRKRIREMRNSHGEWEPYPFWEDRPLRDIWIAPKSTEVNGEAGIANGDQLLLRPVLTEPAALDKIGAGGLAKIGPKDGHMLWGRSMGIAEKLADGKILLSKPMRRLVNWNGRNATVEAWRGTLMPLIEQKMAQQNLPIVRWDEHPTKIIAFVSLENQLLKAPVDRHGIALWRPEDREVFPSDCAGCNLRESCLELPTATGTALLWRRLLLVDALGAPTLRGRVVSYFSGGDGLAIAAALEDSSYPLDELIYDLANLDAGFRFSTDETRWGGRLAVACRQQYQIQSIPGYLDTGIPPKYGDGGNIVVRSIHKDPASKGRFATEFLGDGDIDRVIIEWRSLLRQVSHAPKLAWPRWTEFQALARATLNETDSPTNTDLPRLEYHQTRRVDHRLILRRH
ncbi:MAG TPA: DEAD/DEAH box helicase [Candidatus Limnocylindria bacterium]|nr:DEAD/DEAH box helicase [Candidatus Limnocylindria bacterium]